MSPAASEGAREARICGGDDPPARSLGRETDHARLPALLKPSSFPILSTTRTHTGALADSAGESLWMRGVGGLTAHAHSLHALPFDTTRSPRHTLSTINL